ncbi:hypothetical protein KIN20_016893 [Parelaphostrongylus tenuis]|uniref:FAD dependent oxidoreductase domain-containing protein n=1 Tax=Parelaphostrongylus tenuis TaxID=148309 RepID=A0AAD5QR34_PARTN|nr:hypothetical protein KIN20_016893 [Parelaphostrongylus tenuis]
MSFWIRCCLLLLSFSKLGELSDWENKDDSSRKIAIIGEGVIGLSTALAIKEQEPNAKITIFHDVPFNQTLSKGIAGLFRIDRATAIRRLYGNETFVRLAELWRTHGGFSGVQLLSGHILSDDPYLLLEQEKAYSDIVYNFHFLNGRELESQFVLYDKNKTFGIHYTAFTSEGAKYCPWMKKQLLDRGVQFVQRRIESLDELGNEGFPIVVNCAGLDAGRLAGDDSVYPIRGILLKVEAPWQKHFLMRDFVTFTIPTIDAVYVGTVKEDRKNSKEITQEEKDNLFRRYLELQPSFKDVKIVGDFVGLRPGRSDVRVETESRTTKNGTTYKVVHNYGHGGSGFTIGWGTALHASALVLDLPVHRYKKANADLTWESYFTS